MKIKGNICCNSSHRNGYQKFSQYYIVILIQSIHTQMFIYRYVYLFYFLL
jgi:hypothetical protein